MYLTQLALDTGQVRQHDRRRIRAVDRATLAAWLERALQTDLAIALPTSPHIVATVYAQARQVPGGLLVDIAIDREIAGMPLASCAIARRARGAATPWRLLAETTGQPIALPPPPAPWLAVWHYPAPRPEPHIADWLDGMTTCLAWIWIDRRDANAAAQAPR